VDILYFNEKKELERELKDLDEEQLRAFIFRVSLRLLIKLTSYSVVSDKKSRKYFFIFFLRQSLSLVMVYRGKSNFENVKLLVTNVASTYAYDVSNSTNYIYNANTDAANAYANAYAAAYATTYDPPPYL
jgi:hypothetical protein